MLLRKSNKEKRFDAIFDLSDTEQAAPTPLNHDSSDEEFVVDVNQQLHDETERDLDLQGLSDFESRDGKQSEPRRKKNERSWAPGAAKPLGEVQAYPTDPSQKWTRTYVGPVKRWTRLFNLIEYWFGDKECRHYIFNEFIKLWHNSEILPPKLPHGSYQLERARDGWMPDNFAQELEDKYRRWYARYASIRSISQSSVLIDRAKAFQWFLPQVEGEMTVLLGHVSSQKEYRIKQGGCIPFSDTGLPIEDQDDHESQNGGWVLYVGGIVLSMEWAPSKGHVDQLLAMTVIPYSDQAFRGDPSNAAERKGGAVQIWKFETKKGFEGIIRPASSPPKLVHALCSSWGRISQLQWCSVVLSTKDQPSLLAALCGDGKLRILEIEQDSVRDSTGTFEELQEPIAAIGPPSENTLEIDCFTWITINRLAVALSDGSVAVWSLSPCQQLLRHPVHSSPIMDMVSGYPSDPYIIATMPMGGVFTLTDLNRPTAEKTYHTNPLVSLQPNVVAWSNHLRGFASIWPTSFPGTSTVSFVQSRVFPLSRHICTVDGQTTCLAFGTCHPFLLVGSSDGSVWALNVMRKISSHRQKTHKIKVFQHEYHLPPSSDVGDDEEQVSRRGACRILHGFLPQVNFHPLGTRIAMESRIKRARREKQVGKKKTRRQENDEASDNPAEADEDNYSMVPAPIVIHEPQTRITALSWNPNAEFSWWAAAAMGSGLVRVMDLGVENVNIYSEQREQTGPPKPKDDVAGDFDGDYDGPSYQDGMEEESDGDIDMISYEQGDTQ
ncbi:WD40 repeat-like protein [Hypoxylon crocopeplum]|nr:WD40 repeat-like protein [Hypoxylon crocopeplum]